MSTTKPKVPRIPVQKTVGFREQMRVGAAIANQLKPIKGLRETAREVGLSETMVRRIECRALYKISKRMKEIEQLANLGIYE